MKKILPLICALSFLVSTVSLAQGRVIVFEEEHIQGEIEKPEAFYILSPSNLEYEPVPPEATFLEALYDTLEEAPF